MSLAYGLTLLLVSSIFGAFSTLFFKISSDKKINFQNKYLIYAVFLAGISFILYVYSLKFAPLTFIYLTASVSYIWAILLAKVVLKEKINKLKIYGIMYIVLGIIILNFP
jgi:drug/metabolite transporter (DMT)-like permease